jgi:hypothetical protein
MLTGPLRQGLGLSSEAPLLTLTKADVVTTGGRNLSGLVRIRAVDTINAKGAFEAREWTPLMPRVLLRIAAVNPESGNGSPEANGCAL